MKVLGPEITATGGDAVLKATGGIGAAGVAVAITVESVAGAVVTGIGIGIWVLPREPPVA